MAILRVENLVKTYGSRRVVDGVSFHVEAGEIVGLLGPNGAGKTTSFRMTCGMIEPDGGRVFLGDDEVTNWPMYRRARDGGMGYLAQESSVFRKLTVEQNLLGMLELLGHGRKARKARCDELLEQFRITHIRKSRAEKLSGGERRRLEIARCLVSEPKIILLDEPFAGIDPKTVQSIQQIVRNLRDDRRIAILITDHAARETLQITDRSYVVASGTILCHGSPKEVLNNERARHEYFGEGIDLGTTRLPTRTQSTPRTPASGTVSPGSGGSSANSSTAIVASANATSDVGRSTSSSREAASRTAPVRSRDAQETIRMPAAAAEVPARSPVPIAPAAREGGSSPNSPADSAPAPVTSRASYSAADPATDKSRRPRRASSSTDSEPRPGDRN